VEYQTKLTLVARLRVDDRVVISVPPLERIETEPQGDDRVLVKWRGTLLSAEPRELAAAVDLKRS